MSIKIKFGPNNSVEKAVDQYPTVDDILRDDDLKALMGFGNNVEAHVNGNAGVSILQDNDEVTLVTRASTKG